MYRISKKCWVVALCLLAVSAVRAADEYAVGEKLTAPTKAVVQPRAASREVSWDDLLPKGWDPMAPLAGINLDKLDDADPRAIEAMNKLKAMWAKAPPNPDMTGKRIRIAGFMVPLEFGKKEIREFLLVPYFGACIHVPPPPANQVIAVFPSEPAKMKTAVWVEGVIELDSAQTRMGDAGYRIRNARVWAYEKKVR